MRDTTRSGRVGPLATILAALFVSAAAPSLGPPSGEGHAQVTSAASPGGLAARVESVIGVEPVRRVHWGLLLMDATSGAVLYERNSDLRFAPASNMKIPVTVAALERLGPDYRFQTTLLAETLPDADGRIAGNLFLPGTGDPTLGKPFHSTVDAALEALADSLLAAGVREVGGSLVIDAAAWDSASVPTGWLVGNLPRTAAATGGAFAVGLGELEIEVTGAATAGEPANVSWRPLGTGSFVENRVRTVAPGEEVEIREGYLPESRRWVVEGTITPGARRTLSRAQRDPGHQAAHALFRAIEGRGIHIAGGVEVVWDDGESLLGECASGSLRFCAGAVRLASLTSPPLIEVVREIMGPSQNWMAEQLVRTLGMELGDEGSWDEGFRIIIETLEEEIGIDPLDLYFRDGSGLAGYNLVSPRALAEMLRWSARQPWGAAYRTTMAEPGKDDTTLQSRLPELRGRLFAKTGSITHSNALSGYLVGDRGEELVFVILTNASNLPAGTVRSAIDRVVREFARP